VSPITLDIGSNDVAGLLVNTCGFPAASNCTGAQITAGLAQIDANIASIVHQLHAAAPNAEIILVGLYNPDPVVLPAPGGDNFVAQFDRDLAATAASVANASFANPEPVFNPAGFAGSSPLDEIGDLPTLCLFTSMCPGGLYDPLSADANPHPTMLGYEAMAALVATTFLTH
jgi:lysophospholipase L1-like esterase